MIRIFMIGSLLLMVVAWWQEDRLPNPDQMAVQLAQEPVQTQIQRAAFQTSVGEITYTVQPLYDYDIYGLVVSKHNANSWWDYIHREWNDQLNVTDLCVIWGDNALQGHYRGIDFSSGQFTCYFQTSSNKAYAAFNQAQLSNNHLLTDDPRIAKLLRNVRIGDQIHVRGMLAEYSHNHGFAFKRGTSTVRTDTGNGACETIYVNSAEIIRPRSKLWRTLWWMGLIVLAVSTLVWFARPYRTED